MLANCVQKPQSRRSERLKALDKLLSTYISIFGYSTILYSPCFRSDFDYVIIKSLRRYKACINCKVYCNGKDFGSIF